MRRDAIGFFWNDAPVPKPPKPVAEKRKPPERTWERDDYLPGLEEARQFPVELFTDYTLITEMGGKLIFDLEVYPNYFLAGFMSVKTGRVIQFSMTPTTPTDWQRVRWICENFTLVGFNSKKYDLPMLSLAMAGLDNAQLKQISDAMIIYEEKPWDILKAWKVKEIKCDHIDLIEVAPSFCSLKLYGGRIGTPKMQDLPFHPSRYLTPDQMLITAWYNVNDMVNTAFLHEYLKEPLTLRDQMSREYGIDLRSKSDAQIADAVIGSQIRAYNGTRPKVPEVAPGTVYRYNVPDYMAFRTPALQHALELLRNTTFVVSENGHVGKPPELEGLKVQIGDMVYSLGIGGLHSTEKKRACRANSGWKIVDIDMESYYPRIILNQRLYPEHLGEAFLQVFNNIVERRIAAKRAGDKPTANSLKITINGTFGKLGDMHSIIYAPGLLTQVTMTGQFSILMLIEWLEMYGIRVISANTDGITVMFHESLTAVKDHVVNEWSKMVQFKPEENEYLALYNKDVNNYIAVKPDGKCKTKGIYANPWNDDKDITERLKKNPSAQVCVDAIEALFTKGVPVDHTIRSCSDVRKFMAVRNVTGGAVKDGEFLGKSIRWYYARNTAGEIISAKSGHTVPLTEKAKPCMTLPQGLPDDIDYEWYVQRAERHLKDIGYYD